MSNAMSALVDGSGKQQHVACMSHDVGAWDGKHRSPGVNALEA